MPETQSAAVDLAAKDDLISFLKAIPGGRCRIGIRYTPLCFLLLVAVLGLFSGCVAAPVIWKPLPDVSGRRSGLPQSRDLSPQWRLNDAVPSDQALSTTGSLKQSSLRDS
ncbi:MAG: hypothetical protein WAM11_04300 [Cyanobium sp.]